MGWFSRTSPHWAGEDEKIMKQLNSLKTQVNEQLENWKGKLKDALYELRLTWTIESRKFKARFKRWKEHTFGLRKKVIHELLNGEHNSPGYYKRLETEKIMEMWIAKRINDGFTQRRPELLNKQKEIEELELFIKYLEELKKQ